MVPFYDENLYSGDYDIVPYQNLFFNDSILLVIHIVITQRTFVVVSMVDKTNLIIEVHKVLTRLPSKILLTYIHTLNKRGESFLFNCY